ncbi:GtrA family protein [Fundicoccus culcitae]|uniref:GtrA family protein n=1 Tax=Fundicoccus culcitae TaxID=2969821 RepID=A0ABY5P264_9LACT|nr:GtrA family protein [Fundicoccus culcitae]UUX32801.1 GtrA family protein [Fundicoccus culcitae]
MKSFLQLFRFAIVGGLATAIDFVVLYICYHMLGMNYLVGTTLAFIISTIFNYWASMSFVFVSKYQADQKQKEFTVFLILSLLGLILTNFLMYLAVDLGQLPVMFSKILVTVVVMAFNFISRKIFLENHSTD